MSKRNEIHFQMNPINWDEKYFQTNYDELNLFEVNFLKLEILD